MLNFLCKNKRYIFFRMLYKRSSLAHLSRDELAYELYIRGKEFVFGDEEGAVDYLYDVYNKSVQWGVQDMRKAFNNSFRVLQELTLLELKYDQMLKEFLTSEEESCTIRTHFLMLRAARIIMICPEELTEHAQHLCKLLYALQMDRKTQFRSIPFLPELVAEIRICQEKRRNPGSQGECKRRN